MWKPAEQTMKNSTSNSRITSKKTILIGACIALAVYALIFVLVRTFRNPDNEFWYTAFTMRLVHGYDYTAFKLFGPLHLTELILTLIASVTAYQLFKRASAGVQDRVLIIWAWVIALEEMFKDVVMLATGQFQWDHLPFHLCGVNIFIAIWYAYSRKDYLAEFLYVFGLSGTWVALITTSWQACPLRNFSHLHSVFFHAILAVYIIMVLASGFRPHIWNIWKVFAVLALTIIPAIVFDTAVDTNFFFLCHTENNPILELIHSLCGDLYLVGLFVLVVICVLVMYIPWVIRDIVLYIRNKKTA